MAAGYPQYSSGGGGGGSGSTGGSYSNTRYGNSNGNIGSSKDSQGMQGSLAAGSTYSNGIAPSAYASSSVQSGGNSASAGSSSRPAQNSPEEIELSRRTAKVHYDEFKAYLEQENHRDPNTRQNAREKLTRLTRVQFQELSTDVYDELVRRQSAQRSSGAPSPTEFLPVKPDFHPKRNAARQKLSTLPKIRFRDLASDVYYELARRYPEFAEPEVLPDQPTYQSIPPAPTQRQPTPPTTRKASLTNSTNQRRPYFPKGSSSSNQQNGSNGNTQQASSAANEMIIPNKSTLVEEDVSMPPSSSSHSQLNQIPEGGRNRGYSASSSAATDSMSMPPLRKSSQRERQDQNGHGLGLQGGDYFSHKPSASYSESHRENGQESRSQPRGHQRMPSQQQSQQQQQGHSSLGGNGGPGSPQWNGNMARASEASSLGTRLIGGYGSSSQAGGDREQWEDELEKVKSDYEYKIATLQSRLTSLESDLKDADEANQTSQRQISRIGELEADLDKMQQRHEESQDHIRHLENELSDARNAPPPPPPPDYSAPADQEEIARLNEELDELSRKHAEQVRVNDNLKQEFEGLVDTLRSMNEKQDELVGEREDEASALQEAQKEIQEWKTRYEGAKTELRNFKATSQLFAKPTRADDDFMPTSDDGAIVDTHVTRFQSCIDDLLIGGRSNAPSSVIVATKQVINAVAHIDEDVQSYESSGRADTLSEEDKERLDALKSKCNATLSNLTTAARNHATGHGLSPVSLLDAAASHLTQTIIELVRLLHMRKAGSAVNGIHPSTSAPQRLQQQLRATSPLPPNSTQPAVQEPTLQPSSSSKSGGFMSRLNSLRGLGGSSEEENRSKSPSGSKAEGRASPSPSVASARSRNERLDSRSSDAVEPPQSRIRQASAGNGSDSSASIASHLKQSSRDADRSDSGMNGHSQNRSDASAQHSQRYDQQQQYSQKQRRSDSYDSRNSYDQNDRQDDDEGHDEDEQRQEDWTELKNYLEAQTEAIVHSITSLLAAIRGGAQSSKLDENLSQIITIVSSIVAILQDNFPSELRSQGDVIIQDLTANCEKLSEMQQSASNTAGGDGTFTKQTKQAMATASFGVAKSLKSMNALFTQV